MFRQIEIELVGTRPLILPHQKGLDSEDVVYDSDGNLALPSVCIKAMMKAAAHWFKYPGKGYRLVKFIQPGVVIEDMTVSLGKKKPDGYLSREVTVGKRTFNARRPKVEKWRLKFVLTVLNDDLTTKLLEEVITKAGELGLGLLRDEFGQFKVSSFKELREAA